MDILFIIILILLNGFFALSEIAVVSARKARLDQRAHQGSNGARSALKLQQQPDNFLSAIQVGITAIGILTGLFGGMKVAAYLTPILELWSYTAPHAPALALSASVLLITYFSIVLGELVPKSIALRHAESIAIVVAPIIHGFSRMFYPFVWLLSVSTHLIKKLFRIGPAQDGITEAELRQMIRNASVEGIIEAEQNKMHEKVFYFADKKARHLMTHRTEMDWLDLSTSLEEIDKKLNETKHSKLLCANGELDHFQGFIYVRDYFKASKPGKTANLTAIMQTPVVVPDNAASQTVLNLIRKHRQQFCVVVNEYGGIEGIITLHDLLDHLVGDMPDEGTPYEPDVFVREDKSILVSGSAPVEILVELIPGLSIDFEEVEYATVAGFVFHHLGRIPQIGESIRLLHHSFEVVDMDGKKIDKILIVPPKPHT